MIGYASRTGTKRNLAALRAAGWRLLVSATGVHRHEGFPYAIDNGAWTAFQQDRPFDADAFRKLLRSHGDRADWIAVPDIVAGGLESLAFSRSWFAELAAYRLILIPVQDGMTVDDVRPLLGPRVGIFLGGTTEWKLSTMQQWGELARHVGAYYHVGRVNTKKRIRMCQEAGAHSFDGTSVSRFSVNLPRLDGAIRQGHFDWLEG